MIFLASFIICDFSSDKYLALDAKDKMDLLWAKITENQTPLGFYSALTVATIFLEGMNQSFDTMGDELLGGRKKLIHTVGTVAKAKYVSTGDHPYTGVFTGCDYMLIRPSVAKSTDPSKSTPSGAVDNFAPGMGLKWLRDETYSANLQAMFGVNGQPSWNFFKNNFSNHIPAAGGLQLKSLALKFSSATSWIQTMGLRDNALINCDGKVTTSPKYPFKLIFKPNQVHQNKYSDTFQISYLDQLRAVPSNTDIYEVYAIDQPNAPEKKIGVITTTSPMVTSKWGDESLFFRHNRMDYDLKEHPEWEPFTPKFSIFGKSKLESDGPEKEGCPFHLK